MAKRAELKDGAIEALLKSTAAPDFDLDMVAASVRDAYGLTGTWSYLGDARERSLRLVTADGTKLAVRIASPDEPSANLVFEIEALQHVERTDPGLAVPRAVRTLSGEPIATIVDRAGTAHALRVLTFVPGNTLLSELRVHPQQLTAEDLTSLGAASGRLARALQGFRSDGAPTTVPWDLGNGLLFSDRIKASLPSSLANVADGLLPRLSAIMSNELPRLRSQVIYNDFHESNVLVRLEPTLVVEGVIDFGDMVFGPLVQDLAVCIASLVHWSSDIAFAASCLARGYQRFMPLEAGDLNVLRDLVLARLLLQVGLVSYLGATNDRHDPDLDELQASYVTAAQRIQAIEPANFVAGIMPSVVPATVIAQPQPPLPTPALRRRREAVLGQSYTFYDEPLELVRGHGCMLYDAAGNQYLDCYNNVANLGHCHPYVVDALARQASTLNTNSRYLHEDIVRLGERLSATLPPHLDTWFFVCTGSEANDLAVRLARAITGRDGMVVTENSYHGNTSTVAPLSLIDYPIDEKPNWIEAVPPPNLYRGTYREGMNDAGAKYAAHIGAASDRLAAAGIGMAGLMIDSIFDANGALVPPPDYLNLAYAEAKRTGALTIADEVQMGFARSGTHMWGFEAFGVKPDIVTMGKPMGNGHPIAALVTTREIAATLQKATGYFNTFGGNTVSAAVGNACLDVLQGENLQANAARSGAHLRAGLNEIMGRHELVGHIHGRGLFFGVELVRDRQSREPAKLAARWVRERMKALGVLVTSTGPFGNIVKIRPPLVFSTSDASRCLEALDSALAELPDTLR